ncbi:MAG: amidohydrolase, partial [Candidatus Aminicenantes bacterium]|nr:amidohydrolase [Candidatus Aminicenantes bacterium]
RICDRMKKCAVILFSLVFIGLLFGHVEDQEKADLVVLNGRVFTISEENPEVQAVAVKAGKIIALGTTKKIKEYVGLSTKVLDVRRKLVLPGFIDAHCHFSSGGRSLSMLDLSSATSVAYIQEKIAEGIKETPKGKLVSGYVSFPNPTLYGELGWPTKEILDKVSPDNPVVMRRRGGHAVWVNSVVLEMSNITKDSEAPEGGEIVFDPKTGEPTGILKEAAASLMKVHGEVNPKEDIERALKHAAKLGLTGIHTGSYLKEIDIYKELRDEGKLTLRVYGWLPISQLDEYIEKGIKQGQGDEMVKVGFLKCYIDGTIGVRSALMFEPFTEEPGNTGLAQMEEEEFYALVEKAHKNGYQVGVHAIGDKAVHWVLNAVERAQDKHGKKGLRHRVEHNTVNILPDTKRFRELGVIASMQPTITGGEMYKRQRLGIERARRVDMVRTLLTNGTVLCWGTDWPVSPINPMYNLNELVNRLYPEQKLTMAEAIKYYTLGPAYASFEEDIKGSLEVGKLADMVVLSKDLLRPNPKDIPKTEVLYTIVGGKIVYDKSTAE